LFADFFEKQPNTKHGKIIISARLVHGLYKHTTMTCLVGSRLNAFLQSSAATSKASTSPSVAVPFRDSHIPSRIALGVPC
jgi:hypothetical protein